MIGKLSVSNAEFAEFKHTTGLSRDASTFTGASYMNWEIRQTAVQHIHNAEGNLCKQITTQPSEPELTSRRATKFNSEYDRLDMTSIC